MDMMKILLFWLGICVLLVGALLDMYVSVTLWYRIGIGIGGTVLIIVPFVLPDKVGRVNWTTAPRC